MKEYFLQKKILKLIYSFLIFSFLISSSALAIKSKHGLDGFIQGNIDALKNARLHSNMGNIYFNEGKYISALKEYEVAFNLAHETQAGGVYLYNIARCYFIMGNYPLAKNAIEGAISKDCINMTYYEMLADCIVKLKIEKSELQKYINDNSNPYNRIIVGLIYLKKGKRMQARATFDDFVLQNPDMIITQDVKLILDNM